jgi:hypothetical protein
VVGNADNVRMPAVLTYGVSAGRNQSGAVAQSAMLFFEKNSLRNRRAANTSRGEG